jgi:hypothetical protein
MRHFSIAAVLFLSISIIPHAQVLPFERRVDWSVAGVRDSTTSGFTMLDAVEEGLVNDGISPCDNPFNSIINNHEEPLIIYFPPGEYLFNSSIYMRSNLILRGSGASNTKFIIDLNGSGNSVNINGSSSISDTTKIVNDLFKNESSINVFNPSLLQEGDWVQIIQDDSDLITSSWAVNSIGQIAQISTINNSTIQIEGSFRMDFPLSRNPLIKKINPIFNVGIECISFERIDDCAPEQSSVIHFDYAVNCWVNGIESNKTTFAHVEASHSSNVSVTHSYFHHGFEYGGGGRAYGVMYHFTTNECLVYCNSFEHLRHSMIVQAGANGNVFAYNRSIDPFWTEGTFFPSNSAGDMVLHGNYPYANLFEQNDGQNIVIDNSHGSNGPFNTFFRNRGSLFGIFFSDNTSPSQNIIGNEIPNLSFPYSVVNYTILGANHFLYGNNNKGNISPTNTENLTDSSYFFISQPNSIPNDLYASIGVPNELNTGTIPATYHHSTGNYFAQSCGYDSNLNVNTFKNEETIIFPNPIQSGQELTISGQWEFVIWIDVSGRIIDQQDIRSLNISKLEPGTYHLKILTRNGWVNKAVIIQ